MKPYKTDVAVLLLFFTRTRETKLVFEAIKEARPSKLFLYQDGPREGRNDIDGIMECRKIVEDIDWECEVYKNYLKKNQGCDPSGFMARKWMFSIVDKGIVLEDDCVPSQSFFPYCKELLDRYENDPRIEMICGMNTLGTYDCGDQDYFFSTSGSIWGCAYWKRVIDEWDGNYTFLNDSYACSLIEDQLGKEYGKNYLDLCRKRALEKKEYFESIQGSDWLLNSRLNIIPKRNMISNVGLTPDAVHTVGANLLHLPRKIRTLYYAKTYDVVFPLRHPKYLANDRKYVKQLNDVMKGTKLERVFHLRSIEAFCNRLFPFFAKL